MTYIVRTISGDLARVLCAGIGALAIQPVLAEPHVFAVLTDAAQAAALIGTATGAVLAVGYAHHRLQTWATMRPVMPAPSAVYAAMAGMPPALQQTAALAQAERRSETDAEHQTYHAVVTFCVIGESRNTFAYRDLRGCVDRPTWDFLTRYLAGAGVLRVGSGQRPTWFVEGWTSARVRVELKRGTIPLPDKTGDDPIVVVWNDYRHTMHTH